MNQGMKWDYLQRARQLRDELVRLGRELDTNLQAEIGTDPARAKIAASIDHAAAGLDGITRVIRQDVATTPTYFPEEATCSG